MSEQPGHIPESVREEKQSFSGDSLAVYAQIIGVDEKRFPGEVDFPQQLELPQEVLGSFLDSVNNTAKDGKERRQAIDWNKGSQAFREGPVIVGRTRSVWVAHFRKVFFGKKPILIYHTHSLDPNGEKDSTWSMDLSSHDIATARSLPRSGYIFAVGSDVGGVFIFQTEKSARLPLSFIGRYWEELFNLYIKEPYRVFRKDPNIPIEKFADNVLDRRRITKGGDYLSKAGYVCYVWKPDVQKEDSGSIVLQRVN